MSRCRNCGADVDGDVCDARCAQALDDREQSCPCGHARLRERKLLPLGTNRCDCCEAISDVYDLFPTCTECQDQFCPACSAETFEPDEKGSHCICHRCAAENASVPTELTATK